MANIIMLFGRFHLFILSCLCLAGILFPDQSAHAQIAPQKPAMAYQATLLSETLPSGDIPLKAYVLQETRDAPRSLADIEKMVSSGEFIPRLNATETINLGYQGTGTWIVFPISNSSNDNIWSLYLGSFGKGLYSNFKAISLYNMNTRQYVVNTQSPTGKNQIIPSRIQVHIPAHQTTFFILYLKPNAGSLTYASPSLKAPNQTDIFSIIETWGLILLGFCASLYFLKIAKDHHSLSYAAISVLWLSLSLQYLFSTRFLYIGTLDMEFIIPLTWVISGFMMMASFMSTKDGGARLPPTLLGGMTSIFLISGLTGLVILKSMTIFSIFLLYLPILFASLLITTSCWAFLIQERRKSYLALGCLTFFLGGFIEWTSLLYMNTIPATSFTLFVPEVLLVCAALSSIIATMAPPLQVTDDAPEYIEDDIFSKHQVIKQESVSLHEAKEQSEHRRLMQVIEQERKIMSDLQVKGAQQTEEMRKSKEAADEANRAKSAFLAIVSHEIRTPMTGILGMLRLLQDTQLSKEQKEYTSTIKDSGDAMLALLNDILDFEKIESGKMDLEHINFDFRRLVRGVHTLMRGHAEAKNVELILEVDPSTPTWLYGDPTRLRQVLLNLINNAIKFTSKGAVYLRIRDLTGENDDQIQRNHQIYFAIQDSGIGIGPESQKKLFMPFAQADSSISRKYGGTGLGLAICKRLIEAMGGAISINSKEGEGSTFFFTLSMPAGNGVSESGDDAIRSEDVAPISTTAPKFKSPIMALIVDDNGINQKVVAGFIEKLGAKSMQASSGADALELVAGYQFDLILMDLQLPDMNGIEVTEHIRNLAIPGKANVPIVALSGNTSSEDVKACMDAGMNDFAAKPITYEKILEILMKVDNQTYFSQPKRPTSMLGFATGDGFDKDQDIAFTPHTEEKSHSESTYLPSPPPSPTQGDEIMFSSTDTTFLSEENFDLDEDEEDSFSLAVRKFEEMERNLNNPQPPAPANGSLADFGLDEDILKSLRSGLSIDQIQEILVSFYEKADELIADIGSAFLEKDTVGLYARAHEFKGMAGNFGFAKISQMCALIEKAAKDGQLDNAKDPIDHLGDSYAVSRSHLNKWLTEK